MTAMEQVTRDLVALRYLRPGSLLNRYDVCGNPGCRKVTPRKMHGPSCYVSRTRQSKSITKIFKQKNLIQVQKQLNNHERMKPLLDPWIDPPTDLSTLHPNKEAD